MGKTENKKNENTKEEKKVVNISLGTFTLLFILLTVVVATVGIWAVYHGITF